MLAEIDCPACLELMAVLVPGEEAECGCGALLRRAGAPVVPPEQVGRVFRAPTTPRVAPAKPPAPLPREAPELADARRLLVELRPEGLPPPDASTAAPARPPVRVQNGASRDQDIPRLAFARTPEETPTERVLARLHAISKTDPGAAAVLRWLRAHGSLDHGAWGLHIDVARAFASEAQALAWQSPAACRNGAPTVGRGLVGVAMRAWWA